MTYARAMLTLIVLTFVVMPLVMPVTPSTGNAPTPTQELTNQQYAIVGSLLRNVRTCPKVSCDFAEYALSAKSGFWFCWQAGTFKDGNWLLVQLPDGNFTTIAYGTRQYVRLEQRYRTGEGC